VRDGNIQWIASDALADEIDKNPDVERRLGNDALLAFASEEIEEDEQIAHRAEAIYRVGYGLFDAPHLAFAEAAQLDALLTTDDSFMRKASRSAGTGACKSICVNVLSIILIFNPKKVIRQAETLPGDQYRLKESSQRHQSARLQPANHPLCLR